MSVLEPSVRIRRVIRMGVVAAALALPACDRVQGARQTYADLSVVRRALQPLVGSAVEARIASGTMLSVAIVNHPIQLRPADEKQAKARELAKAAYDAYAGRAALGGVRVAFVARGGFPLFRISASDEFAFDAPALRMAPSVPVRAR